MSYFGFIFSSSSESIKPAQVFQRLFIGLFLSLPFYPFPSRAEVPLQCSGLELVSLNRISPRPLFEIRYASSNNFLGRTLYSKVDPQLRCPVALALQKVQQDLSKEGLGLKVWDAHRPLAVQQLMWDEIQDPRYVSDPSVNAGRHTRGASVDVTLVNQRGKPLRMPTDTTISPSPPMSMLMEFSQTEPPMLNDCARRWNDEDFVRLLLNGGILTGITGNQCR
jgi:hypothetical protein